MTDAPNIYVSNGTCYTGPQTPADAAMIPCGNAYFQPQACCQHNDHCLESSVCYNAANGVTYVAGCTDEHYNISVCPDKFDDADAPWLGMAYCNGTSDIWVLCDQKGHPATIESPDPCACPTATAERSMTFNQAQGISETASLPDATGLPIGWNTDFYPTMPSTVPSSYITGQSTRASQTSASSSSTTATVLTPSNYPPSFPTSFTTSAKIGTAIGAFIVGTLLLTLLGLFILRRRRPRSKQQQQQQQDNLNNTSDKIPNPDPSPGPDRDAPDHPPQPIGVAYGSGTFDVSQLSIASPRPASSELLDNKAARPWSMVSELDGQGGGAFTDGAGGHHMQAIMEASHGRAVGGGGGEWRQGEAGPSELEAPRGAAELPA